MSSHPVSARKKALVTGITGQDGSYLAELLLKKGYDVHGLVRRVSVFNRQRIDDLYPGPQAEGSHFQLYYADVADSNVLTSLVAKLQPDEIYHLAAQSHVRVSFDIPEYTANVTALGTLRLLEAVRLESPKSKFYQASSSEMFGAAPPRQSENTPFEPQSPYGAAKVFAHHVGKTTDRGTASGSAPASCSITSPRAAGRPSSLARSPAPPPASRSACRTTSISATWTPAATGATPPNTWKRCGG